MNDSGGHGGDYPPDGSPANELPAPGRPPRRQVRTRLGGVGEALHAAAEMGAAAAAAADSQHPPPTQGREPLNTDPAQGGYARAPRRIDSALMMEAVKADTTGQGPGIVVVVTHASGRERTEVFRGTEVAIGRDRTNDLVLTGDGISRRHAVLMLNEDNLCTIIDLGSTNGTFVNEEPIEHAPVELSQQDFVTLGEFALRVRPFGEAANVDPSTMQINVPAAGVMRGGQPAEAAHLSQSHVESASHEASPQYEHGPQYEQPQYEQPPPQAPRFDPPPYVAPPPMHISAPASIASVPVVAAAPVTRPPPPRSVPPRGPISVPPGPPLSRPPPATRPPPSRPTRPPPPPKNQPRTHEMEARDIEPEGGQGTLSMPNAGDVEEEVQRVAALQPAMPATVPAPVSSPPGPTDVRPPARVRPRGEVEVLPQTGPRSRPSGDLAPRPTPIGMPVPPRTPTVPGVRGAPADAGVRGVPPDAGVRGVPAGPGGARSPTVPPLGGPESVTNTRGHEASPRSAPTDPTALRPGARREGVPSSTSMSASTRASITGNELPAPEPAGRTERTSELPGGPDSVVIAGRVTTDSSAALESLLADPGITRVSVNVRRVSVERRGAPSLHDAFDFATEDGVLRALARVCERGGVTAEGTPVADALRATGSGAWPRVRATLSDGWILFVVRPPAAPNGHLVELRRDSGRVTLEDLCTEGWLSAPMTSLALRMLQAGANVLCVGTRDDDVDRLVRALCASLEQAPLRLVSTVADAPKDAPCMLLDAESQALRACGELSAAHVVMPALRPEGWRVLLEVIRGGREGVLARMTGPGLRAALERTAAALSTQPSSTTDSFRAWLASSFAVGIEVMRVRDGAPRVTSFAELDPGRAEPRELFRYEPDPAPRGTFHAIAPPERCHAMLRVRGLLEP